MIPGKLRVRPVQHPAIPALMAANVKVITLSQEEHYKPIVPFYVKCLIPSSFPRSLAKMHTTKLSTPDKITND